MCIRDRGSAAALANDPRWIYLRADERLRWQRAQAALTADDHALFRERWTALRRIAAVFRREDVVMLAGTDTPMPGVYPGYSLHEELELLVAAGLSPREALRAATSLPAHFSGMDANSGAVAAGSVSYTHLDVYKRQPIRVTTMIRSERTAIPQLACFMLPPSETAA